MVDTKASRWMMDPAAQRSRRWLLKVSGVLLGGFPVLAAQDTLAQESVPIDVERNVPYGQAGEEGSDELIMDIYQPPAR